VKFCFGGRVEGSERVESGEKSGFINKKNHACRVTQLAEEGWKDKDVL